MMRPTKLLAWADDKAGKVIAAVCEDVALQFLESDADDDEQLGSLDLMGEYDPIVDETTGSRLSDAIKQSAEKFRQSEKVLRRLYVSTMKRK